VPEVLWNWEKKITLLNCIATVTLSVAGIVLSKSIKILSFNPALNKPKLQKKITLTVFQTTI